MSLYRQIAYRTAVSQPLYPFAIVYIAKRDTELQDFSSIVAPQA